MLPRWSLSLNATRITTLRASFSSHNPTAPEQQEQPHAPPADPEKPEVTRETAAGSWGLLRNVGVAYNGTHAHCFKSGFQSLRPPSYDQAFQNSSSETFALAIAFCIRSKELRTCHSYRHPVFHRTCCCCCCCRCCCC